MKFLKQVILFFAASIAPAIGAVDLPPLFSVGGQLDDVSTVLPTENNFEFWRITPKRAGHVNLRDNDGNQFGVATNPIIVAQGNSLGAMFFSDITTAANAQVIVNRTPYTEQTTDARRSIKSSSTSDAFGGTGAITVHLHYFNSNLTGLLTETITLNGTTCVQTTASNIAFIESIEVISTGSTKSNVGTLTLSSNNTCGGTTIGTVAPTNNRTLWGHHYIASGKICNITGISVSHSGTTVGSGGVFSIFAIESPISSSPSIQISDFIRLYGQSSTFSRTYSSPIKVIGPAKILVQVTPETTSSTVYRTAVDFYEQ
jgi:hypothetical protein